MNVGVVLLNYMDYASSIRCLHSIHKCRPQPKAVVVIDNDSPNDSIQHLRLAAAGLPDTHIIKSEKNGGFSAGHNQGIKALQKIGCANFVLATSDTEIVSEDLFDQFEKAITEGVGVIGPNIEQPDRTRQNPPVEKLSFRYCLALLWFCWGRPGRSIWQWIRRIAPPGFSRADSSYVHPRNSADLPRPVYKLHGAFMMLTDEFIRRVGVLEERIFMFGEEDLIAWQCEMAGLKRLLIDSCLVRHQNDSSIESAHGKSANDFVLREEAKSGKVLRQKIVFRRLFRQALF